MKNIFFNIKIIILSMFCFMMISIIISCPLPETMQQEDTVIITEAYWEIPE